MAKLNRLDRVLVVLAGVLAAITATVLMIQLIMLDVRGEQQQRSSRILAEIRALSDEVTRTLIQLNKLPFEQCGPDTMIQMRRTLFLSNHIKDIGFISDGHLVCSTGLDFIAVPAKIGKPSYVGKRGFSVWLNEELTFFDMQYRATVVGLNKYNVVFDLRGIANHFMPPYRWELMFLQGHQRVHVAGNQGLYTDAPEQMGLFYFSDCIDQDFYCVATDVDPWVVAYEYRTALSLMFTVAVLIGILTSLAVLQFIRRNYSLAARVRRGLCDRSFYCVYQPIVALNTQRIVGCEVLARFSDKHGQVFPDQFIPEVRKNGLTWPFTQFIAQQALLDLDKLTDLPDGFRVSINIFPQDLSNGVIKALPDEPGVAQCRFKLVVEVTEDEQLEEESSQQSFKALRDREIGLAIDDFGTGYSNLKQLKRIECQWLKIDRSYVMEMEEGSIKSTLIPHVADIAHKLGLVVVAEGIENAMQHKALLEVGIEFGQGWAFGKPMSAQDLAARVAADPERSSGTPVT